MPLSARIRASRSDTVHSRCFDRPDHFGLQVGASGHRPQTDRGIGSGLRCNGWQACNRGGCHIEPNIVRVVVVRAGCGIDDHADDPSSDDVSERRAAEGRSMVDCSGLETVLAAGDCQVVLAFIQAHAARSRRDCPDSRAHPVQSAARCRRCSRDRYGLGRTIHQRGTGAQHSERGNKKKFEHLNHRLSTCSFCRELVLLTS
jgi:hypothetical protein